MSEYCFLWLQTVKRRAGPSAGTGCRPLSLRLPRMHTARCDRPFSGQARRPLPTESFPPFRVPANHSSPWSRDSSGPHLPAFAVRADSGHSGMMVAPIGLSGDTEFPKNSINFDKFTGFFDKFPKIKLSGNDAADSGRGGILPRPVRPPITANARKCAFLAETPDSS